MKLSRRGVVKGSLALGSYWATGCALSSGGGTSALPGTKGAPAPRTGKRILILGGTGFLGPQLVEVALARGHTVTLFNRGKTRPELFPDVEKLRGDRSTGDLEALKGRQWDAVIDTSGFVPRLVRASAELLAPSVGHYLFFSSISVYKPLDSPGVEESSPVATVEDETTEDVGQHYGALKALCEKAAEAAFPGRATHIRPGLIVGPGDGSDRFTYWPVRVDRGGEVLAPGTGAAPVQFIDVRDLAAWTLLVLENAAFGTFNAVGLAQPLTMRELLERCRAVNGGNATFTWVDEEFLGEQGVKEWMELPLWLSSRGEMAGLSRVRFARAQARGLTFRPMEETLRDTLAWFKTLPPERQGKLRAGLSPERERELLAAWHSRAGTAPPR